MTQIDYSNEESIKQALAGVDVVISTVPATAFDIQWKLATAAKEVDVKLFVPSEFGGISEGASEGLLVEKAKVQAQLKSLGLPYTAFYTGAFADSFWEPYVVIYFLPCLFCPVNQMYKGPYSSISRVGKCPLVAMATSLFPSPPGPT